MYLGVLENTKAQNPRPESRIEQKPSRSREGSLQEAFEQIGVPAAPNRLLSPPPNKNKDGLVGPQLPGLLWGFGP